MPLYEYQCRDCSTQFECLAKYSESLGIPQPCPDCKSLSTEKKLASGSFRFDGGSPTGSRPGV